MATGSVKSGKPAPIRTGVAASAGKAEVGDGEGVPVGPVICRGVGVMRLEATDGVITKLVAVTLGCVLTLDSRVLSAVEISAELSHAAERITIGIARELNREDLI